MSENKFSSTSTYIATDDLMTAVNASVELQRPILIKGEPGTGKTQLAIENRQPKRNKGFTIMMRLHDCVIPS